MIETLLALGLLIQSHMMKADTGAEVRQEYVRLTYYTLRGTTYSGTPVGPGVAACSRWIPLGTIIELPDGTDLTCFDRGLGDYYWKGWVDAWAPSPEQGRALLRSNGDYTWISILRWGYDGDS